MVLLFSHQSCILGKEFWWEFICPDHFQWCKFQLFKCFSSTSSTCPSIGTSHEVSEYWVVTCLMRREVFELISQQHGVGWAWFNQDNHNGSLCIMALHFGFGTFQIRGCRCNTHNSSYPADFKWLSGFNQLKGKAFIRFKNSCKLSILVKISQSFAHHDRLSYW